MHPSFTDHMSTTRMEQFQREATVMQRVNHAKSSSDNPTGSSSLTHILRYLFFGLNLPSSSQKQGEAYTLPEHSSTFKRHDVDDWMHSIRAGSADR